MKKINGPQNRFYRTSIIVLLGLILIPCFGYGGVRKFQRNAQVQKGVSDLLAEANQIRLSGEYSASKDVYLKCLELSRKKDLVTSQVDALIGLALAEWDLGNLIEYDAFLTRASEIAKRSADAQRINICKAFNDIYVSYQEGKKYRTTEQYSNAIGSFKQAIDLARKADSQEHEVKCIRQLSSTYWQIDDYHDFFLFSNSALTLAQLINNKKEEGNCLNNIGLYFWKIGNYSNALTNYEKAYNLARSTSNVLGEAECLNNIGLIYREIGNYERAVDSLTEALAIDQKLNNGTQILSDLNNLGATYRNKALQSGNQEDYEAATITLDNCLLLAKRLNDKHAQIRVMNNLGGIRSDLGDFVTSLAYFESAFITAESVPDKEAMSMILNNTGVVQFNLGNFEKSTNLYQRAIDLALEIRGGQVLWEAYLEMGNSFKKQSRIEEAITSYKNSINIIESIRSTIDLEESKASYLGSDKRIEAYQNLIDILSSLSLSKNNGIYKYEAFHYLEKAKSRAFLDSLEVSEVNISQDIDMKQSNQEKEMMKEISRLYTELLLPNLGPEKNNNILRQIKACEEKSDELKRQIRATSPAYSNLKYPEIITYEEVQKTLAEPHTTFLAYSLGKEQSFGFAITKDNLRIFRAPSRKEIQKQVIEYRKIISDKDSRDFRGGRILYEELVGPGIDRGTRRLVIVPDDILNLLPFETLRIDGPDKKWLVEECAVSYVPSLSALRELAKRKRVAGAGPRKDLLAFGDPYYGANEDRLHGQAPDLFQDFYLNPTINFFRLKFSGLEVERIASMFKGSRKRVFERKEASEEHLKAEKLSDYKIIHFAAHGLIDDKKPARSSIILALDEEPSEDGFLQMREIFNLKMNADLVVLSACQTGLGQFIRGEGIEGLSRAFFYGGASSVLMSLWAVNDEATCQLMERFYHHLKSSESSTVALREAKLEMIHSPVFRHPFYWAGFIINGKTDGTIFRHEIQGWLIPAIPVFGGLVLLIALRIRKRRRS
jgi:CHAT domain-containing protein/tetratricopeptide (TPR) repeat protein